MRLGLSEDEFWRRTPRQIARTFEAHWRRITTENNHRIAASYNTAVLAQIAFRSPKKMPRLQSLLARERVSAAAAPRPVEDQWRQMRAIGASRRPTKQK